MSKIKLKTVEVFDRKSHFKLDTFYNIVKVEKVAELISKEKYFKLYPLVGEPIELPEGYLILNIIENKEGVKDND